MDIFDLPQEQFEKEYKISCLHISGCDTFEFNGSAPRCLECEKDCPYKIESVDAF